MICDLAEVYRIYDYRGVPGRLLGALVAGLGPNSRVHQRISGQLVPTDTIMLSMILDELRKIIYVLDTNKNKKYPELLTPKLVKDDKPERDELAFSTPEEFEKARAVLLGEINGGD